MGGGGGDWLLILWVSPDQEGFRHTMSWVSAKHMGLLIHRRDFSTDTLSKKMKWCTGGFDIWHVFAFYGPVRFYCTYRQEVSLATEAGTNPSTKVHNLVYFSTVIFSFNSMSVQGILSRRGIHSIQCLWTTSRKHFWVVDAEIQCFKKCISFAFSDWTDNISSR